MVYKVKISAIQTSLYISTDGEQIGVNTKKNLSIVIVEIGVWRNKLETRKTISYASGGVAPLLGHNEKIHTKVRKSNDSSKFADRVVRGSLEEMLLFDDNTGRCNNAMKLVSNKMVLKNAYLKIKSDLGNSSRVDKAIFDAISEE